MTGAGMVPPGGADRNKRVDVGGADAVPDTPHTAKAQGAEPSGVDRRRTPRGPATSVPSGAGMKPVVWIVIAIIVIAAAYFLLGR